MAVDPTMNPIDEPMREKQFDEPRWTHPMDEGREEHDDDDDDDWDDDWDDEEEDR